MLSALTDLAYNLGGLGKAPTLLKDLQAGNYEAAAKDFELYNRSLGKVNPNLVARRFEEEQLFRRGMAALGVTAGQSR